MNSKTNWRLMSLVLGLGLTLGLLGLLNKPFTRPLPVAHGADRQIYLSGCTHDSIQAATDIAKATTVTYTTTSVDSAPDNNDRSALAIVNQGQLQNLSNPIAANSITIDNTREGWESAVPYTSDPSGDGGGGGNIDWITITMAHDGDELYIRYEVDDGPRFDPDNAFRYSVFVDIDRNRNTGYIGEFGQISIGADMLFQGRYDTGTVKASVFRFIGAGATTWSWSLISDNSFDDQVPSGTKRDIEWKTLISDLDVSGSFVNSFNWVATQEGGINDFYPDGGNGGAAGDFNTYTFSFPNPERGFYHATETHSNNYTPLDLATLQGYRQNEGIALIHRMFYLEDFVNGDISQAYLDNMEIDFDTVRAAGLKVIVRFAYTNDPYLCDAPKEWILRHIEQLGPVLQANSDVIAAMQAGFIGAWGEWWYSCHFAPNGDWDDRREVLFAILGVLPSNRMVQLRTPRYKQNIFSITLPISPSEAHSGTYLARTGHHNDCFVSSARDYGTYIDPPTEYPYLEEDTKYVVMGGETGDPSFAADPAPDRLNCYTATKELEQFHWSFLNIDWYTPTLHSWRDNGCLPEIQRRLGYRFTLVEGAYADGVRPGDEFAIDMKLRNDGWAAPFNPRLVELWLRRKTTDVLYYATLPDDPRFWLADASTTYSLNHTICTPIDMPLGDYELLLRLPDPEPSLYWRTEYAIRLANHQVWEDDTGYNRLVHTITVTGTVTSPACDSPLMLKPVFKVHLPVLLHNFR